MAEAQPGGDLAAASLQPRLAPFPAARQSPLAATQPLLLPTRWRCPSCSSLGPLPDPQSPDAWPLLYEMGRTNIPSPRLQGARRMSAATVAVTLIRRHLLKRSAGAWLTPWEGISNHVSWSPFLPSRDAGAAWAGWGAPPSPLVNPRHGTCAVPNLSLEPHRKGQQPRAWPLGHRWDHTDTSGGVSQPSLSPTPPSCSQAPWGLHAAPMSLRCWGAQSSYSASLRTPHTHLPLPEPPLSLAELRHSERRMRSSCKVRGVPRRGRVIGELSQQDGVRHVPAMCPGT